jgi:hypothetical protein
MWVRRDRSASDAVALAIRLGALAKQRCIRCGNPRAVAHHEDYSKPLDVMWLCRKHHSARHRELGHFPRRPKRQPIALALPPELIAEVDAMAAQQERSRAKMMEILLRGALERARVEAA